MNNMDALLEAAAEDIKLIDCLGPEDLCLDPTSANGLKPLQSRGLRSRSNRTTAYTNLEVAAAGPSVKHSPPLPSRRRLTTTTGEATAAPTLQHGSANATLAAALLAGDFYAPESPAPVSKRPAHTPAQTASPKAVRPATEKTSPDHNSYLAPAASPKYVRPANKKPHPTANPLPLVGALGEGSGAAGNANNRPTSRGSSAQPVTRVQRFGASILHYLHDKLKAGKKETLESVIRRDFGNNPDISKALRLLVAEKNVMRVGKGGRADPFTYQLAPAALQSRQLSQHTSETAPAEAVAAGHDSLGPLGEAAAEADMGAGASPHGITQPTVSIDYTLPAMLARAPKDGRQTATLPHSPKHVVSQVPVCSESPKRSASLPAGLAIFPAAAAEICIPHDAVSGDKPSPESRLAHSTGKLGSLGGVQGHRAMGPLGAAADPSSNLGVSKNELQPAYSLPLVYAATLVAPSLPTAASASTAPAAEAAADSVLHNPLRNSAASSLPRSAFRPYNGKSFSLSSQGIATADTAVPGSTAGKPHDIGLDTHGSNCKAPMGEDKENLLPAKISRPTLHVSQDPASMSDTGSGKLLGAVSKSGVSSPGQSVGGVSSADGVHDAYHLRHTAGAKGTEPGNNAASKRAKLDQSLHV